MARVIPGVEVKVEKAIVPQQLNPSGVVGIIGTAAKGKIGVPKAVGSYAELTEEFGTIGSLPREARQAFLNGVFQVFATRVEAPGSGAASQVLKGRDNNDNIRIFAKARGEEGNAISVVCMRGEAENTVRIEISAPDQKPEAFDKLIMDGKGPNNIITILNEQSKLVSAELLNKKADSLPKPVQTVLEGGKSDSPPLEACEKALEALELETNVDVVYVADSWDPKVHALVDAHCKNMSIGSDTKPLGPRIGIGTVAPGEPIDKIVERMSNIASDRFILVAPYGFAGAIAGLVSKLAYFESPTFKALSGVVWDKNVRRYTPSEQMNLVSNGVLTIDSVRGRGVIAVKGITTSKEQISVQRVVDHSVRGVKNIGDLFIGTLNNASGRMALKERLTEFLIGMEKEGAIVPSTDGTQPAFLVDVYSSQADFSQGIVRVNVAVRPVRAMDFIYATISVQS